MFHLSASLFVHSFFRLLVLPIARREWNASVQWGVGIEHSDIKESSRARARARAIGNVLQVGFLENFGSFFVPRNLLESSEGPPTCVLVLSKFKPRHRTMQEVVLKNDVVVLLCPLLSFSFVWLSSVLQAAVLHDFYPL